MKIVNNKKMIFHAYTGNTLITSMKNKIYMNDIPVLVIRPGISQFNPLLGRLLRSNISNVGILESNLFFSVIRKKILIFKKNELLNEIKIERGSKLLRNGIVYVKKRLIFGDYWRNTDRETVNVYSVDPLEREKEIIIQLKNTRHIHFIQKDGHDENSLIIGTGDNDIECGLYHYNLSKKKLSIIGKGSQQWRTLGIIQKNDHFFWGSDYPDGQNFIYKYNRKNKELKKMYPIEGPAYYSAMTINQTLLIGTAIEDRKKHKACIYVSNDGENWHLLLEFQKDMWHSKYFGYGTIEFIQGQDHLEDIYINLKGLKKSD